MPEEVEKIRGHGARDYPHECCGMLLGKEAGGRKVVTEALAIRNAREDSPTNRFLISPDDWRAGEKYSSERGLDILGFYHSHPDHPAQPSEFDLAHAWPWFSYMILSVQQRRPAELTSWVLAEDRSRFDPEDLELGTWNLEP